MKTTMVCTAVLGLVLVGCGSSDDSGGADAGAAARCTQSESLCTTLHVPDSFGETPRQILVGLFDALPPAGPPLVVATVIDEPAIAADHTFELTATELEEADPADLLPGNYYVYVVLYVEGGGQFQPEPGIDYVAWTETKQHLGEEAVNLPDMMLGLAE